MKAYKITLSDGTTYVASINPDCTDAEVRRYFIGAPYVTENFETGKETHRVIVNAEEIKR